RPAVPHGDNAGDGQRPAGDGPGAEDAPTPHQPRTETPPEEAPHTPEHPEGDTPTDPQPGKDEKPQEPSQEQSGEPEDKVPEGEQETDTPGNPAPADPVQPSRQQDWEAPDSNTEDLGADPEAPPATRPLPTNARSGHILERIDETRVYRDDRGLIDQIDGRPAKQYVRDLMTARAEHMVDLVRSGEDAPSQAALGGKPGAVNALVLDRRTGMLAEGINGRGYEIIRPQDVHPLIEERVEQMRANGPYPQFNRHTGERLPDTEFPHNDHPLRHAEVKALNHLLNLRGESAKSTTLHDLRVDAMFTLWKQGPTPANCCANCTRIVDGANVSVGRNWSPPGTPGQQETIIEGDL
ncbi:hypothetical protein ACFQZ2_09360, partial [Streptomonospora algeriensis]